MSKKQIRISEARQIVARFGEFANRKVSIVLKDNTVVFGELKKIEGNDVYLTNMRLKKIKLRLENISELFTDVNA